MPSLRDLQLLQALPLSVKIEKTKRRIHEWVKEYGTDGVYISFSGGKDSTVLLDLTKKMYDNIPAVFCDTGLEYPEIRDFVYSHEGIEKIKPEKTFRKVIEEYGYPFFSKEISDCLYRAKNHLRSLEKGKGNQDEDLPEIIRNCKDFEKAIDNVRVQRLMGILPKDGGKATVWNIPEKENVSKFCCKRYLFALDSPFDISNECCDVMKKKPFKVYSEATGRYPMTAQMASESRNRTMVWLRTGCNSFGANKEISNPMAFWTEQDVLLYLYQNKIPIAKCYGEIVKENEVDGQYDFGDLGIFDLGAPILKTTGLKRTGCMFCGFGCQLESNGEGRFEKMKSTHPKTYEYIMKPLNEGGLGYKQAIDWINEHGNMNIRY